ncbi:acetamidase/formamidase family protein [Frankia sp. AgB1.9]|uniref:acetamidase/formamidase family protein n=1 Tax=unclassified Frankia TaxID=2632575 RepID=UPI00193316E9|nr:MULTISPECIES: acetamidase/formamidase family protein [unclassified Frankia]MBL7486502.1 acetamidase/formamidase family protein [Frankia sp. AgW1.1]MBL7552215.1 acetamidase/formamidase family protein [Frankia sp. AgB1.9]MBL7617875.1 acetamidase/formamidase family protein [Frankia sp. AgB1.8]
MIEPFRVLQRLDGSADAIYIAADPENVLWGRLPTGSDRAVHKVAPGAEVLIDTISHEGVLEDQGRDPVAFFAGFGVPADEVLTDAVAVAAGSAHAFGQDGPHVITGPIAVLGAQPGDLLAVRVLELTPRAAYGVISNRHGRGALPGEMPAGADPVFTFCRAGHGPQGPTGTIDTDEGAITFPLRFFLGIMGVAPADEGHHSSVPPGRYGGNLDVSMITAGATLYLPVQVPEALAYIGDPHFAQGDGEVALTAFEAPLRARLRFDLITREERAYSDRPYAETDEYLIPIGLDEDLGAAMRDCVRGGLELLERRYRIERSVAYAYLSAATDFAVSQVVDVVQGVHAKIRKADLAALSSWPR